MALTQKQEAFVQAYHRTGNQNASYREAYDAENMSEQTINNKASLLMKRGDIRGRLAELQERVAKKTEITVETITKMLAQAYKIAVNEKQTGAAVAASMGLGKLHGLIVDKKSVTVTALNEMADDELVSALGELRALTNRLHSTDEDAKRSGTGNPETTRH